MNTKSKKIDPKKLDEMQQHVLVACGTEQAFSGKLLHNKEKGTYTCANCNMVLFDSDTKFDSGTGWPSFFNARTENVETKEDTSLGVNRIEVLCKTCGGHVGHVFEDGPNPTGKRYCINSAALEFKKEEERK